MYADGAAVYGCTSTNQDDQSLAADLISGQALTVQWGKDWLVTFRNSKTKLVTFHHQKAGPEISFNHELLYCQ